MGTRSDRDVSVGVTAFIVRFTPDMELRQALVLRPKWRSVRRGCLRGVRFDTGGVRFVTRGSAAVLILFGRAERTGFILGGHRSKRRRWAVTTARTLIHT